MENISEIILRTENIHKNLSELLVHEDLNNYLIGIGSVYSVISPILINLRLEILSFSEQIGVW
jgi:hypothetical protein